MADSHSSSSSHSSHTNSHRLDHQWAGMDRSRCARRCIFPTALGQQPRMNSHSLQACGFGSASTHPPLLVPVCCVCVSAVPRFLPSPPIFARTPSSASRPKSASWSDNSATCSSRKSSSAQNNNNHHTLHTRAHAHPPGSSLLMCSLCCLFLLVVL
jgi:hypothetical protein